jgi:hypothetical protein
MTTTQATTPARNGFGEVLDVMRSITSESDLWRLSDVLLAKVPNGTKGLQEIVDRASTEGVLGSLSMNTLRAYRTTAAVWAPDKRVPKVSFSAHREAERLNGGITAQRKLLLDVAKAAGGTDKVTVARVRDAVRAKSGKAAPAKRARPGAADPTTTTATGPLSVAGSALADLKDGGKLLIAAVTADSPVGKDLDALHNGTSKVLAHIEGLRMKQARAAKQPERAAASAKQAPKVVKQVAPAAKRNRLKGL